MLVNIASLTPTIRDALHRLIAEITRHDGVSPVNESATLGIEGLREADFFFLGSRADPYGFAVCDERDQTILLGVHPQHRRQGVGTELLTEALASYPDFAAWAFGTLPGAPELAARLNLVAVRELLRMERPLRDEPVDAPPSGYEITPYTPADRDAIVAVNAAAFAHHPEQGRLTVAEFDQLTQQDWFDPAGLFVAKRDGQVAGFHWTKRHGDGLGEVYVIAVAPGHEGHGLGRVLLTKGLRHLEEAGDTQVQLYVEASEERVVRMYRNAGFTLAQTDTSYQARRPQP